MDKVSENTFSTLVSFQLPNADQMNDGVISDDAMFYYLCSLERTGGHNRWIHQGADAGVKISTFQRPMPKALQVRSHD